MSQQKQQQPSGPPYASPNASPGGIPGVIPDVPVTAVLLGIYLAFAATNMTILQLNLRRKHKFIISGALFGFSMSRVATCALRLAWAAHTTDVRLAIAAGVFVNAGVLILYVVNLVFAQRLLRARRPALGWHRGLGLALRGFYAGIAVALVLVIYAIVQASYTLRLSLLRVTRDIQLAAVTYLFVFTTLPVWLLLAAYVLPGRKVVGGEGHGVETETEAEAEMEMETFGSGTMGAKVAINALATCVCVVIAGFKTGTLWESPRPVARAPWYDSKPAFYVFSFALEIGVLSLYTFTRVDRRFHVPDGSAGPGDYSRRAGGDGSVEKGERSDESAPQRD
ncbi:hypothetical protein F4861DRAFT_280936 [Xylaria intraflava]|nr:hypothetical protein F4861DRAFT_280936 [Xylaria intraflava]